MASRKTGLIVGAVAGVGVAAAAMAGVGLRMAPPAQGPTAAVSQLQTTPINFAPPPGAPMSFADIFEKVSPAVVSIDVKSKVDPATLRGIPGLPFSFGPRDDQGDGEDQGGGLPRQQSSGSGFFISADGYLVTNNHVVEGADEIMVTLKDGRELPATLVGRDDGTDLAVLKVKGSGFTFVSFENTAKPRVGDWVITVGNPFGLGGTATAGIVSALARDINDGPFVDFIQVDAPINRGNSGGPTFDTYGRVIGVNSAIYSPTGGSVGIGFAIPADLADSVSKQLIQNGKVTRGYIGATIQNFTPDMAQALGLGSIKAAIVADLTPGGPAAKAGLMHDDIIVAVNGNPVTSSTSLTREVAKASPGGLLKLDVLRDGKKRSVEIRSGTRPSAKELAQALQSDQTAPGSSGSKGDSDAARPVVLGMALGPIDAATKNRLNVDNGVLVEQVRADSDAAEQGVRRGAVIVSVNTHKVNSASEVASAVDAAKKAGRPTVLLGFSVSGSTQFVPVKIPG
ncbi:MAG: Do family serine endopeptidase [Caulobacter sp.]|nr:Do family serine endopeptidase [Caulobacter sp.]